MFTEDTLSSVVQCRVFLQDKRHFAHTWHLFKTITGAVGLEPVGLNLHVWTQHIWGDRKATTIDQSGRVVGTSMWLEQRRAETPDAFFPLFEIQLLHRRFVRNDGL